MRNVKMRMIRTATYYPYGEPTIEPAGQRWLFGGKEREHAGGRNSYDYGARNLIPAGSWSSADPLATDFYPLSPFSYCGGDPINYVDPNGMLRYIINEIGELKEIQDNEDGLDYIDILLPDGNYAYGEQFKEGTIERITRYPGGIDVYRIRGDEKAKKIFEFIADNTKVPDSDNPGETTGVEFSLFQTGLEGESGLNFLSTSHLIRTDKSVNNLVNFQLRFGYTVRSYIHNHPSGSATPSKDDIKTLIEVTTCPDITNMANMRFYIYAKKNYHRFNENSRKKQE